MISCAVYAQQAVQVDGKTLQVELTSEDHSRKLEVFREAQISFNRQANELVRQLAVVTKKCVNARVLICLCPQSASTLRCPFCH